MTLLRDRKAIGPLAYYVMLIRPGVEFDSFATTQRPLVGPGRHVSPLSPWPPGEQVWPRPL